jgi:hypothetical protein
MCAIQIGLSLLKKGQNMKYAHLVAVSSLVALALPSAHAGSVYLTGSSASQPAIVKALQSMCGSGAFKIYIKNSGADPTAHLENKATYECLPGFIAQGVPPGLNTVYHSVYGGSLNAAIAPLQNTAVSYVTPCAGTPLLFSPPPSPVSGITVAGGCPTTTHTSDGGFSDVDPQLASDYLVSRGVNISGIQTTTTSVKQSFGIAVSDDLYVELYKQQYGTVIPADCTCPLPTGTNSAIVLGSYPVPRCQPSVSYLQMQAVMSGNNTVLAGGTAVFPLSTPSRRLVYCRAPVTSGVQINAERYFLQSMQPMGLSVVGAAFEINDSSKIAVLSPAPSSKLGVLISGSVTDILNCLGGRNADATPGSDGTVSTSSVYRIAIVSGEQVADPVYKQPLAAQSGNWKFVRLNEARFTEGTVNATNTFTARFNQYPFVSGFYYITYGSNPFSAPVMGALANTIKTLATNDPSSVPGLY